MVIKLAVELCGHKKAGGRPGTGGVLIIDRLEFIDASFPVLTVFHFCRAVAQIPVTGLGINIGIFRRQLLGRSLLFPDEGLIRCGSNTEIGHFLIGFLAVAAIGIVFNNAFKDSKRFLLIRLLAGKSGELQVQLGGHIKAGGRPRPRRLLLANRLVFINTAHPVVTIFHFLGILTQAAPAVFGIKIGIARGSRHIRRKNETLT